MGLPQDSAPWLLAWLASANHLTCPLEPRSAVCIQIRVWLGKCSPAWVLRGFHSGVPPALKGPHRGECHQ